MEYWSYWVGHSTQSSKCCLLFKWNKLYFARRLGTQEFMYISINVFGTDDQVAYVEYTDFGSKNRPGGKKQLNLTNKTVHYYAQPALGNKCHVLLLRLYISKLPLTAIEHDNFYCKPGNNTPGGAFDVAVTIVYASITFKQQFEASIKNWYS